MKNILLFLIIVFCKIPLNAQVNVMPAFQAIQYNVGIIATGGTITTVGNYKVHTFNSSGTFTINKATVIEILVVAGGGSGGEGHGGGGGAGGLIYKSSFAILGQSYPVVVGAGGPLTHFYSDLIPGDASGSPGNNSVFSNLTAIGGGFGSTWAGGDGGSGGGSSCLVYDPGSLGTGSGKGVIGQGNDGGPVYYISNGPGQGGGGAGASGQSGSGATPMTTVGGNGGMGLTYNISGSPVTYAGGGGGGGAIGAGIGGNGGGGNGGFLSQNPTAGVPNTGGGGGGGAAMANYPYRIGFAGGSGIVIIRYRYR